MKKEKLIYTLHNLPKDQTDFARASKMTDVEINQAARSDPDALPLSTKELSSFKKVNRPKPINVQRLRATLRISQAVFADCFGISKRTLQDWEQGKRKPTGPSLVLLTLIAKRPALVHDILSGL